MEHETLRNKLLHLLHRANAAGRKVEIVVNPETGDFMTRLTWSNLTEKNLYRK